MGKTIFLLLLLIISIQAKSLDFYKEDISFRLTPHTFYVNGIYFFKNNTDADLKRLIYFPVDSSNNSLDSIRIFNLSKIYSLVPREKRTNGFFFEIDVNANDSALYQIRYQQKISSDSVKYILRSTKSWQRPLKSALYKLVVDKSLRIENFTYEPDKIYDFEDNKVYLWLKNEFLPDCDLIFKFKIL